MRVTYRDTRAASEPWCFVLRQVPKSDVRATYYDGRILQIVLRCAQARQEQGNVPVKIRSGYLLLTLGLSLTVLGLLRGEAWRVLTKAIIICLECIGIG